MSEEKFQDVKVEVVVPKDIFEKAMNETLERLRIKIDIGVIPSKEELTYTFSKMLSEELSYKMHRLIYEIFERRLEKHLDEFSRIVENKLNQLVKDEKVLEELTKLALAIAIARRLEVWVYRKKTIRENVINTLVSKIGEVIDVEELKNIVKQKLINEETINKIFEKTFENITSEISSTISHEVESKVRRELKTKMRDLVATTISKVLQSIDIDKISKEIVNEYVEFIKSEALRKIKTPKYSSSVINLVIQATLNKINIDEISREIANQLIDVIKELTLKKLKSRQNINTIVNEIVQRIRVE